MKTNPGVQTPLKEIHPDFFFCFTSGSDLSGLNASIQQSGIQTPLCALQDHTGFRLCSGFRRFRAASELELESVPVRVLPGGNLSIEAFRDILLEHLSIRPLNLVEKARVLRIARSLARKEENVLKGFLSLLELPQNMDVVREMLQVLAFHPDALAYVEKFDLSVKIAKRFSVFTSGEQSLLAGLASELSIRPVELFVVADELKEIAMRENRTVTEMYQELNLAKASSEAGLSRNERIGRIKQILHCARYPFLSEWNERLDQLKKEMCVPPQIQLSWDKNLETPGIRLNAEIRNAEDLCRIAEWFLDLKQKNLMDEILKRMP